MAAYYNEIDPYVAQWLRNLIAAGHIAPGDVDERSITDVQPDDLRGYTQCHFFAGIGGWSRALRLAGWPDNQPVWTGSCPCQPFSAAGKGGGFDDERHLWPAFFRLIAECAPSTVFGEQVASPAGLAWLDLVQDDMEGAGRAFGAADLCVAGIGAPHIRQRLLFVADADDEDESGRGVFRPGQGDGARLGTARERFAGFCTNGKLADAVPAGRAEGRTGPGSGQAAGERGTGELGEPDSGGRQPGRVAAEAVRQGDSVVSTGGGNRPGPVNGFWRDADWLLCRDGKWRPVESGTFPLAHGVPARVGQLRAYGNAIVPQVAAEFIAAYLETRP